MPRRSSRRNAPAAADEEQDVAPQRRRVANHVRDRQRAVAEREAARLARPEGPTTKLEHADRKKSAVTSTPFGHIPRRADLTSTEEWCGPFSVARQFIEEREEARRKEEEEEDEGGAHPLDEAMEELEQERKRRAHPSLQWKGQEMETNLVTPSMYAKRRKRAQVNGPSEKVPSLFSLCISYLVANFEFVEALGDVDHGIRMELTKELIARNQLDEAAFQTIAEPGIETLEIVDCSSITQEQLKSSIRRLLAAGLRYLILDQAGRCFSSQVVDTIIQELSTVSSGVTPGLETISVGGAYLLSDSDAARLIAAVSPKARCLDFKACPLLSVQFSASIHSHYSLNQHLLELVLEDCGALTKEAFTALLSPHSETKANSAAGPFSQLKSLSLRRMEHLDDSIVLQILSQTKGSLEGLDLTESYHLTDSCLAAIREHAPNLRSLKLSGLKLLSAPGLEAFFTPVAASDCGGVSGLIDILPPSLRILDLSQCHGDAVTDDIIKLAAEASTQSSGDGNIRGGFNGGLVQLDIQGSYVATDTSLENLIAAPGIRSSLRKLNVSFCPHITDQGLGYLVDECGNQLSSLSIWGNAQITDGFLDGHRRTSDPDLQIVGAWMRGSSSRPA
jgi:Leucine Rich repeat